MAKTPIELAKSIANPTLKKRDDAYNQTMNEYHAKRKALLDADKYLEPEWDDVTDKMLKFRSGYEKAQPYSLREYMLDYDPNEFQMEDIRDDIDFKDIWDLMNKGEDFYKVASTTGEGFDSAVREKLFNGMANELGLDYDDIYYKWLGKEKPNTTAKSPYKLVNNFVDSADAVDNPLDWAARVLEESGEYDADTLKTAKFIIDRWGKK